MRTVKEAGPLSSREERTIISRSSRTVMIGMRAFGPGRSGVKLGSVRVPPSKRQRRERGCLRSSEGGQLAEWTEESAPHSF